jgi:hypothetical protein
VTVQAERKTTARSPEVFTKSRATSSRPDEVAPDSADVSSSFRGALLTV